MKNRQLEVRGAQGAKEIARVLQGYRTKDQVQGTDDLKLPVVTTGGFFHGPRLLGVFCV
jgi:hypothetical protein